MNQFSIKARLMMGFGVIVALFILFAAFVYKEMIDVDENLDLITEDLTEITEQINEIDRAAGDGRRSMLVVLAPQHQRGEQEGGGNPGGA